MPIVFISPKKRKQQLATILVIFSVFLAIILIWKIFFQKVPKNTLVKKQYTYPEININFDFLDSKKIQSLEPYPTVEIQEEKKIGRENIFSLPEISPSPSISPTPK